ncbi:MAG: hypothetical protein EA390_12255 [Balneolaceae bacterium]|nr:MAG: hypothetical protein EA390_12255 [Balneolaceae bacterium]
MIIDKSASTKITRTIYLMIYGNHILRAEINLMPVGKTPTSNSDTDLELILKHSHKLHTSHLNNQRHNDQHDQHDQQKKLILKL